MDDKEKQRLLGAALGQIEKQFGKGTVQRLGSHDAGVPVSIISSGSVSLDAALGIGGFPRGRIVEVFGPESSGKTTIALQAVAQAQKSGGMAAFVDVEHALDPAYARKLWWHPTLSTYWLWIRWPRWSRKPNWTVRWATPSWACRRA